jgi:tRNA isopentenyl-2-thiomethyl-A-37 hydroxylase MiaE
MSKLKTTKQWWTAISTDPDKLIKWLKDQYHGEVTAEKRIRDLITTYSLNKHQIKIINHIADDEAKHARWVKQLLTKRGIVAKVLEKEERYWDATIPKSIEINTFEYACAVAHLAELMRLDRIKLLSSVDEFHDIAEVFKSILPDEEFHVKAFGKMTTDKDIKLARKYHNIGLNAIGLIA